MPKFKIRYEVATGVVNLITNGDEELHAEGCKYMTLQAYPAYDDQSEKLYVRDDKVVAIRENPDGGEHIRLVT